MSYRPGGKGEETNQPKADPDRNFVSRHECQDQGHYGHAQADYREMIENRVDVLRLIEQSGELHRLFKLHPDPDKCQTPHFRSLVRLIAAYCF
jgi:hypothetical protein